MPKKTLLSLFFLIVHGFLLSMSSYDSYLYCDFNLLDAFKQNHSRSIQEVVLTDSISLDQLYRLQVSFPAAAFYTLINGRKALLSLILKPPQIVGHILEAVQKRYLGCIEEVIVTDVIFLEEYELLQGYFPAAAFYILRNGRKVLLLQDL